jgi:hypothetical protein
MFTSHLLLAQTVLKDILTSGVMLQLRSATASREQPHDVNSMTCDLLEKLLAKDNLPSLDDVQRTDAADSDTLIAEFRQNLNSCLACGSPHEMLNLLKCQGCSSWPTAAHITSCLHLYCEVCFQSMREERNELECGCGATVQDTKFCYSIDSVRPETLANPVFGDRLPKENKQTKNKRGGNVNKDHQKMDDEEEDDLDWVTFAGHLVPGAKLTAIRTCISAWFKDAAGTKVIIFTQFLDMVRILSYMCMKEGWGFTTVRKIYSRVLTLLTVSLS